MSFLTSHNHKDENKAWVPSFIARKNSIFYWGSASIPNLQSINVTHIEQNKHEYNLPQNNVCIHKQWHTTTCMHNDSMHHHC
ncbi:hypothetical protein ACHAWX_002093 [Stephanocyclus meneghinianus]